MVKRMMITITFLVFFLVASSAVMAAAPTAADMVAQLFTSETLSADWFSVDVLAQVPLAQLEGIIQQYKGMLGGFVRAEGVAPSFNLVFENGSVQAQLVLDSAGKVAGFWLGVPVPKAEGLQEVLDSFAELPGAVSVIIASETGVLGALEPSTPLGVGSAFKLAVLAALKDQINAGVLAWDDTATLEEKHISLPTGMLQDWPIGTPLTIQTLASLMISISDNTATDMLIDIVGREFIEMYAPRNVPFLTTRELFVLKDSANSTYLEAFRQGDTTKRREILQAIQTAPLPDISLFSNGPVALDLEWFFTVGELANLMYYVKDLPLMTINPGVTNDYWQRIAFKGGSEPGVINLTSAVTNSVGKTYLVSATWNNNQLLDETRFISLFSALLNVLAQIDAAQ
jgi:beta-lactamase class A